MAEFQTTNPKLRPQSEVTKCPNCGAPLLSEVCTYCGVYCGEVSSIDLAAEYPMVECKLAKFTFWNTIFMLPFVLGFTLAPLPAVLWGDEGTIFEGQLFFAWIIFLCGIGFSIGFIRTVVRVVSNRFCGKVLEGTVFGYMDDTVAYNGVNGQRIKILVTTREGKKFVLLPLEKINKPYEVNSKVNVRLYRNTACIIDKKPKDYNW